MSATPIAAPDPGTAARALAHGRRVHLIAICGVAMSAFAGMLKERGYEVSGSDENVYPPISTLLERLGIAIRPGFRPEHLADRPDLVIVGNSVSRANPEAAALLESGLPYVSFPQALGELFLADKRSVVIAGTHGKTTSTAMLAWVLHGAGRDPSFLVGGESLDFGVNFRLGSGPDFVIEGDEYDTAFFDKGPKFLHYHPQAALLTAVEFDHADIYRDLEHVKSAFRRLLAIVPPDAPLITSADFPHALELAREVRPEPETFGLADDATWRATDLADTGALSSFSIRWRGRAEARAAIAPPGAINVRNALGVYAMARALGLGSEEILPGLRSFRGVARRQQLVGTFGGVTIIDDFAHHPTAVAGAIAALRARYRRERLWAVFEPRSNTSRRKVFQREYTAAFANADAVVIAGVFQKQTDAVAPDELFSPQQLVDDIRGRGMSAVTLPDADHIAEHLAREVRTGDLVLLMSNGGFGGLRDKLVTRLVASADPQRR